MSDQPKEATVSAWVRLLRAHRVAMSSVERALKAAGMLPLAWYDVLLELDRAGEAGLRPFELEHAMLLEQYNLSRLLARIERAGLIERRACDDDGRGLTIIITDRGRTQRREMWPIYASAIETAVGAELYEQDILKLNDILGQFLADDKS